MLNLAVLLNFIQPSVDVFDIRIDEPVTLMTDMLLAGVCFYAFFQLHRQETTGRIREYFKYYFLTLGLGAFFGGLFGHAFLYALSPPWKLVSWTFILISVAFIAIALMEMARPLIKPIISWLAAGINLLVLAAALIYTFRTLEFSAVQYYNLFGMVIVVGSFSYIIYRKTGSRGMVWLLLGIGVGLVSVAVFNYQWGISPWFNHRDICHVILSFSALAIYKGASMIINTPGYQV